MRLLVTGAAGFIGSHIVEQWSAEGEAVGIDDLSTGDLRNLEAIDCELVQGGLRVTAEWMREYLA